MKLTHRDHAAVSNALLDLYAHADLARFSDVTLNILNRLIDCDVLCYNEHYIESNRVVFRFLPEAPHIQAMQPVFLEHLAQHPMIQHFQRHGDCPALSFSDLRTRAELARMPLYNEFYRPVECPHQVVFYLADASQYAVAFALNRGSKDFSQRDKAVCNLLRPHFEQSFLNAWAVTLASRNTRVLSDGLKALRSEVIPLKPDGRPEGLSPRVLELLQTYFPFQRWSGGLPETLAAWLKEQRGTTGSSRLENGPNGFLSVAGPARELQIRVASSDAVVLHETTAAPLDALRARTRLTPREIEVVRWLIDGKGNHDISILLGTSIRTIHKHLERIFQKLGVENRTAAVTTVLALLREQS
jgi:DNA-binding CsgD family transcriptional regulator